MEKVMVVPAALLEPHFSGDAFITTGINEIISLIMHHHIYINRNYAETAEEYKQVIPYAILINGDRFFLTRRLKKQTENRLHGLYSLGLGGHINPTEENSDDVILEGMHRELLEEVGLTNYHVGECVGIINDYTAEVSNYHLGLVFPIHVSKDIYVRETSKMTGEWVTEEKICLRFAEMESWSRIVWEHRDIWNN